MALLRIIRPADVGPRTGRDELLETTIRTAASILERVKREGDVALRKYSVEFGELWEGSELFVERRELVRQLDRLPVEARERLERISDRIRLFAEAQHKALREFTVAVPGGRAGQTIAPVERAGCYAPGGRYPLPSTVLMTATTAVTAGVEEVWVASPRPAPITLAAAALAGADGVLAAGGAHAIAALAWGTERFGPCDVIVGPGNAYVTAAKKLLAGEVRIDMLAGPSEVVILADESAPPAHVAADLLAQAEHDADALSILVTPSRRLVTEVESELEVQLRDLPTSEVASAAVRRSYAVPCADLEEAIQICDRIAPEHLELMVEDPDAAARRLSHYGGLFVGNQAPTALGDYGAGPNHVLPTGGTARSTGGLSVLNFLRIRTWLGIDDRAEASALFEDAVWLARQEGLEAHARCLEQRSLDARAPIRSHQSGSFLVL